MKEGRCGRAWPGPGKTGRKQGQKTVEKQMQGRKKAFGPQGGFVGFTFAKRCFGKYCKEPQQTPVCLGLAAGAGYFVLQINLERGPQPAGVRVGIATGGRKALAGIGFYGSGRLCGPKGQSLCLRRDVQRACKKKE